ncbi:MAG TPA: membrane dipeptidase [Rhabdochlamydiaceae bacterium]|jgi:microsomal dipeptidase-like Zn-dependent dipeptidase|nr:membrane dipeptidase [Rhabdochlamydiaceae bacterium]
MKIADLHCDLLSYLAEDGSHTPLDPASRASIPLLKQGSVAFQIMAIFTKTEKGSVEQGIKQAEIFFTLPTKYPVFGHEIQTGLAIENASGFCDETEPLSKGIERLEAWLKKAGRIAYMSLTWNGENRFGGGNGAQMGLKKEGLQLLQWMSGKKIAIDLSHTSDKLAEDILKTNLDITPIASHSNFRKVADHPRNLPDHVAKEIGARGGVIGLNFVRVFLGGPLGRQGPEDFLRQVDHADKLGLLDRLSFGADFFADHILPPELNYMLPMFNSGFDNASCYPKVIALLEKHLPRAMVEKIAHQTLLEFLQ